MTLIRVDHIYHLFAVLSHDINHLVGFFDINQGIIDAVKDQKWGFYFLGVIVRGDAPVQFIIFQDIAYAGAIAV